MTVFPNGDIVGSIQALAVPLVGEDIHLALAANADDSTSVALAGVEPPLRVERVAIGSIRVFPVHFGSLAGNKLEDLVVGDIAEQKKAVARPDRSFGKDMAGRNLFEFEIGRV